MDIFARPGDNSREKIILPEQTHSIQRVIIKDKRHYEVKTADGKIIGAFPSVTSVLGATKDQEGLDRWRDKVGHDVAEQIGKDAVERGTVMHRLCELYCELPDNMPKDERLQAMLELSRHDKEVNQYDARAIVIGSQLFFNFYQTDFFERIVQGIFQEKFLWNHIIHKGEDFSYAGTVDNFSVMDDGLKKVVDFKTAKKAKQEKWIISYKKQCAAYAHAIKERYGIMPEGAEIWISNEVDRYPQCFTLNANDIKHFFREFLKDRRTFNEIMSQSNTDMEGLL